MTTNTPAGTRWVSFDAPDGDTWLFDLSFFGSNWHCIYGNGCGGIEEEVDVAGQRGCCSYGAHFADDADLVRVMRVAEALPNDLWQHHTQRSELDEPTLDELTRALTTLDDEGARVTTVEDGACVFLNRPGFAGGAGYGPAAERDPAAIRRDLALGYISAEAAKSAYGLSDTDIEDVLSRAKQGEEF